MVEDKTLGILSRWLNCCSNTKPFEIMSGPWMTSPVSSSSTQYNDDNAVAAEKLTLAQNEIAHIAHAPCRPTRMESAGIFSLKPNGIRQQGQAGSPSSRMNVRSGAMPQSRAKSRCWIRWRYSP